MLRSLIDLVPGADVVYFGDTGRFPYGPKPRDDLQKYAFEIGELLVDRGTGRIGDLHESRAGCIYIHAVTQLEISSTEVRNLISAGRDPRFLMPDPVRKVILDSGVYARKD